RRCRRSHSRPPDRRMPPEPPTPPEATAPSRPPELPLPHPTTAQSPYARRMLKRLADMSPHHSKLRAAAKCPRPQPDGSRQQGARALQGLRNLKKLRTGGYGAKQVTVRGPALLWAPCVPQVTPARHAQVGLVPHAAGSAMHWKKPGAPTGPPNVA